MEVEICSLTKMCPLRSPLVITVLGRWTGHNIEFAGDYGVIYENLVEEKRESWNDITDQVAAAVLCVFHEGWYS